MGCYVSVYLPPNVEGGSWEPLEDPNGGVKWTGYETTILTDAGLVSPSDGIFEWDGTDVEAAQVVVYLDREHEVFERKLGTADEDWGEIYRIEQKLVLWRSLFRNLLRLRARGIRASLFGA